MKRKKMVYYFTSSVVAPPAVLFMGDDKEENELLIKYGWPEDVWFHVDKLSSAHVYLRLQTGQQLEDISEELIEDCCQLVKANSIEGCKLAETDVVYTMWSNLKKTGDMVTGQVGFHKNKDVKKVRVEKQREVINRLNKTKKHETGVDFRQLKETRDMEERKNAKEKHKQFLNEEKAKREAKERESKKMSYDRVFTSDQMVMTNKNTEGINLEEDFM